jgi:hypothetical protein
VSTDLERQANADVRELAARVVHSVYRLVKGRLLHAESNQAIVQLVDGLIHAFQEYCDAAAATSVSILFAAQNVFVDRQMLKSSRETYQLAIELGGMLEPFGITELTFSRPLERTEVHELGRVIAVAQRDKSKAIKELLTGFQTIRARRVVAFSGGPQLTPVQRAARTFAASVLIVQAFYRGQREGATDLPHAVKRVAQRLVTSADEDARLLLAIAASPGHDVDRSAIAVSSAIIALAMARQLVSDRSALLALASAAILFDAGRTRLLPGSSMGSAVERNLSEDELERLPASTAFSLTALGKLHPGSLARAVIAYEAQALRGGASKVYGGRRPPAVLARVLHAARVFVEARAAHGPGGGGGGGTMDDAVQGLYGQARDATERTYAKLLLGALGLFPAGTLVSLTTGELAVVTATPRLPVDFARPPVRILYDKDSNLLEAPIDLDLSLRPKPGEPVRLIVKTVDADEQQMRQMRAYVVGLATAGSRARETPPPTTRAPHAQQQQPVSVRPASTKRPATLDPGQAQAKATLAPRPRSSRSSLPGIVAIPRADPAPVVQELVSTEPPPPPLPSDPPPSSAVDSRPSSSKSRLDRRADATVRPRRDPRADEDDVPVSSPPPSSRRNEPPSSSSRGQRLGAPSIGEAKPEPWREAPSSMGRPAPPVRPVTLQGNVPSMLSASTRALSWDQYGEILAEGAASSQAPPEHRISTQPPPAAAPPETDSLLADYLDDPSARGRSHGGLRWGGSSSGDPRGDGGDSRHSAGLRWSPKGDEERRSSGGRPAPGASSHGSVHPERVPVSSHGHPSSHGVSSHGSSHGVSSHGSSPGRPSSPGSWGGAPPSRGGAPPSRGGAAGRVRTRAQDWSVTAPPSQAQRASEPPRPPSQPPSATSDHGAPGGPTSRKPKAGNLGWGTDKK